MHRKIAFIFLLALSLSLPAIADDLLDAWDMVGKIKTREDLYVVSLNGKWGIADGENNVIVEPRYDAVGEFFNGAAAVCIDEKWGLISDNGETLLEPVLREEPTYRGDYAVASITSTTEWEDFSGAVEYLPLYGVIDRRGNTVIPFEYDEIKFTDDGTLLRVEMNNRCGYMDLTGEYVIPLKYVGIELFEGDYAVATYAEDNPNKQTESYDYSYSDGVIDRQGNVVIPFEYDSLIFCENGLIRARRGEEWGYINLENEEVIELKYAAAYDFINGCAAAAIRVPLPDDQKDSLDYTLSWGVIDETGKIVLPFEYDSIEINADGAITASTVSEYKYFQIADSGVEEVTAEEIF